MIRGTEPRDAKLTVRLPQALLDAIEAAAEAERRSTADIVVLALADRFGSPKPARKGK